MLGRGPLVHGWSYRMGYQRVPSEIVATLELFEFGKWLIEDCHVKQNHIGQHPTILL